jgi:hypothetical protein
VAIDLSDHRRGARDSLGGIFALASEAAEAGRGGSGTTLAVQVVHIGAVAVVNGEK